MPEGPDLDQLSLTELRRRRSEKWRAHPPDVLPAWIAEMDYPLAAPVARALSEAIAAGDCGYAHPGDLAEPFAAYAARGGWAVDPRRVTVVGDVLQGVAETLRLLTGPGDGVVVNTPAYPPFFTTIDEVGRRVVEAPLARAGAGWALDLDAVEVALAAGARAYLLCNPHNPTGLVLRREQVAAVAELAGRYGAVVLSDEVHAPLVHPGAAHTPLVSLGDEAAGRAVTLTSASKAWNIAGLKCAVVVAGSEAVRARLATLPPEAPFRAGHLGLIASIAAWRDGGPWLEHVRAHLDRNRHLLAGLLREHLPAVGYVPPEASYLAWLDCNALGLGRDPAAAFLARGRVALTRGLNFGRQGAGFARLNFATSAALLTEAVERMAKAA